MLFKIVFLLLTVALYISPLMAYESEEVLKVKIVGKVAKFVRWNDSKNDKFIITILNNPYGDLFDRYFIGKTIHKKKIKLKYINSISKLSETNILYIPAQESSALNEILKNTHDKNILTISDIRGFVDRDGILQISFVSQKVKLKINLKSANDEEIKINSSLLRISDVVR